ncbi:VOC family protein [Flavobacteriaceae bacterium TP-CH-4]|uniref:VOC family protein n=1 Tax=Pelagihabitans pacificus TaxID=2696054 RepID=A0A967AT66_9FLAO|nr:VOC family protein [Pelagihabitans pacificus]NHF58513.1 VOC family protein [Pelagihabitans pacificus]
MKKIFETYRPEGFGTVNSYLFIENPEELIDFLKYAFYAEEINRSINPKNGDIANVILKIGNSCFMISQARGQFLNMRTAFYLYVEDVDEMHKRAIEHGAISELEPSDMDYGDRQSGIVDPSGNYWWISKRLVRKGYHENQ